MDHSALKYKYSIETSLIIACAMEVHKNLGNGLEEDIYHEALATEMQLENISFTRDHIVDVFYKGEKIGNRKADFLVDDKIIVEIKSLIQLEDFHLTQTTDFIETFNVEVGLLINFGAKSLEFKRTLNKNYKGNV